MELFERAVETASTTIYVGDERVDPVGDVIAVVDDPDFIGGPQQYTYTANGENGLYTVQLGLAVTDNLRRKWLHWEYDIRLADGTLESVATTPEPLEVVRPYVSIHEYNQGMHPSDALLMSDFRRIETVARKVIESYTRQSFQIRPNRTYTVNGSGTNALQLPDRLVALRGISTINDSVGARLENYTLMEYVLFDASNPWSIRARYSGAGLDPVHDTRFFAPSRTYAISGDWGWLHVPDDVKRATALLVRDYMDDDALYREKYITVIRAADWRMEFGATGSETTGNANADMMLEKYRNYRPEVI